MILPSSRHLRVRRGVPRVDHDAYNPGISRRTRHGWLDRRRRRARVRAGQRRCRVPRLAERGWDRQPGARGRQRARAVRHPGGPPPGRARDPPPAGWHRLRSARRGDRGRAGAPHGGRRRRRRVRRARVPHRRAADDPSHPAPADHPSNPAPGRGPRSDDEHARSLRQRRRLLRRPCWFLRRPCRFLPITIPTPPTAGGGTSGPVGTVVRKVTGTEGGTVSGTGSGVGTIVKQVTAPVGGPVSGVGSGLGDTITKVTGRLGGILGGG